MLLLLSWIVLPHGSTAAVTNSTGPGTWSSAGNWDNGVPGANDDANVFHPLTIDQNIAPNQGDYIVNGRCIDAAGGPAYTLNVSGSGANNGFFDVDSFASFEGTGLIQNHGNLIVRSGDTLIIGALTFANGSSVLIETGGFLIVNGNLTNNNNSTGIVVNGNIIVDGNVTGGNGSSITGAGGINATGTITTSGSGTMFGGPVNCTTGPCSSGPGALPVRLLFFEAVQVNSGVEIFWKTQTEENNEGFRLEKSSNGLFFSELATIQGVGTSFEEVEYSFFDANPFSGMNYYRLIQVDKNLTEDEIGFLSVYVNSVDREVFVFPNPIGRNQFSIGGLRSDEQEIRVRLMDIAGRQVGSSIAFREGSIFKVANEWEIESGVYFVELSLPGDIVKRIRIVKK